MGLPALFLQVLEGWEPQEYAHYFDQVEAALTAAVQDALGETRTNGRTAFAAYAAAMPDRASALLRRFDSGLQQKLHEAVVAYGKGHTGELQTSPAWCIHSSSSSRHAETLVSRSHQGHRMGTICVAAASPLTWHNTTVVLQSTICS